MRLLRILQLCEIQIQIYLTITKDVYIFLNYFTDYLTHCSAIVTKLQPCALPRQVYGAVRNIVQRLLSRSASEVSHSSWCCVLLSRMLTNGSQWTFCYFFKWTIWMWIIAIGIKMNWHLQLSAKMLTFLNHYWSCSFNGFRLQLENWHFCAILFNPVVTQ